MKRIFFSLLPSLLFALQTLFVNERLFSSIKEMEASYSEYTQRAQEYLANNRLQELYILYQGAETRFTPEQVTELKAVVDAQLATVAAKTNCSFLEGDDLPTFYARYQKQSCTAWKRKPRASSTRQRGSLRRQIENNHKQNTDQEVVSTLIMSNDAHGLLAFLNHNESDLSSFAAKKLIEEENLSCTVSLMQEEEARDGFDLTRLILRACLLQEKDAYFLTLIEHLPASFLFYTEDVTLVLASRKEDLLEAILDRLAPTIGVEWDKTEPLLDLLFHFPTAKVQLFLREMENRANYERMCEYIYQEVV